MVRGIALAIVSLVAALEVGAAVPAITGGKSHSLALGRDGVVRSWGDDSAGQLGSGRKLAYLDPHAVTSLSGVASVSTGSGQTGIHVLALKSDGTVWAWGANDEEQLGDESREPRSTPAPVAGLSEVQAVAAGGGFSLALKRDGTVWAWGNDRGGALGTGSWTSLSRAKPMPVKGLDGVTSIAAGPWHVLALRTDGSVWAWGDNYNGELGIGSSVVQASRVPVQVSGLAGIVAVSAGERFSLALGADGAVYAWGLNNYGQLGDGTNTDRNAPIRVNVPGNMTAISAGRDFSLALRSDGTVWAWGFNLHGALGRGSRSYPTWQLPPAQVTEVSDISAIAAGSTHALALRKDGAVFFWGENGNGQFGDGTTQARLTPAIIGAWSGIRAFAAGDGFTLGVHATGGAWAAGSSGYGQAGDGISLHRVTPGVVTGLGNGDVKAIASAPDFVMALKVDGTVWTWGFNDRGQLGDGTNSTLDRSSPAPVAGLSGVAQIAAARLAAYAIKGDGSVWKWGAVMAPEYSYSSSAPLSVPRPVPALTGVASIATGSEHLVILKADGTVWTMGANQAGQLGDGGTSTYRTDPFQVPGITGVVAVASGDYHSVAVKSDGTIWSWGAGGQGQLGDGTTANRSSPVRVTDLADAVAIAAGTYHTLALRRDGSVWEWGTRVTSPVSFAVAGQNLVPARVADLPPMQAIAAGSTHSLALRGDGTVWAWGLNNRGQLGDGSLAYGVRPGVVRREGGSGTTETNDWFLDLDPVTPDSIPAASVPPILLVATGNAATTLTTNARFRAQDAGREIRVFAYAPTAIAGTSLGVAAAKDDAACTLAQFTPAGLQATTSTALQSVGNVLGSLSQSVTVLENVGTASIAGATFCVGVGTGSQSVESANSQCVVTVPGATVCLPPASSGTVTANAPGALSGLWWNATESGWGIHFTQRRNIVFAAWYTYDGAGNPKWYVASSCAMPSGATGTAGVCNGTLYEVSGPAFFGTAFNASAVKVVAAGNLSVDFSSATTASMTYTVGALGRTVPITRQAFASGAIPGTDYTDLWWNPSESGWGMAVAQQGPMMFLAWYVYDAAGEPTWYVASSCAVSGAGCSGALYRTTGPAFGPSFDASHVQVFAAGSVTLSFSDPNNGLLTYTVNGVTASKAVTRQLF